MRMRRIRLGTMGAVLILKRACANDCDTGRLRRGQSVQCVLDALGGARGVVGLGVGHLE